MPETAHAPSEHHLLDRSAHRTQDRPAAAGALRKGFILDSNSGRNVWEPHGKSFDTHLVKPASPDQT
jgi:hypothetical protein